MAELEATLLEVLERARHLGFLGPGPLRARDASAQRFVEACPASATTLCDLGSGGGLPALPLLIQKPSLSAVLIESMARRAAFLHWALAELGLERRVRVDTRRAEEVAHDPEYRSSADVVTARGFGPPAMTAEIAVALVRSGGVVLISEPPVPRRWIPYRSDDVLVSPSGSEGMMRLDVTGIVPDWMPRPSRRMRAKPLAFLAPS